MSTITSFSCRSPTAVVTTTARRHSGAAAKLLAGVASDPLGLRALVLRTNGAGQTALDLAVAADGLQCVPLLLNSERSSHAAIDAAMGVRVRALTPPRRNRTSVTHLLPTRQEGRDHLFQRVVVAVGPREADAAALRVEEAVVVLHEVRP